MFIGRFQRTDYTDFEEQFLVCSGTLHISHQMIMRLELSLMNCFLNWTETDHNGQLVDSPKLDGKARGKPRQDGRGAFRIEHGQGQRAQVTAWSGGPDPTSSATITLPLSQRTSVAAGVLCDQLMEKECKKLSLVHECVVLICNCERKWTAVVLQENYFLKMKKWVLLLFSLFVRHAKLLGEPKINLRWGQFPLHWLHNHPAIHNIQNKWLDSL